MALDAQRNWNVAMAEGREATGLVRLTKQTQGEHESVPWLNTTPGREVHLPIEILLNIVNHIDTVRFSAGYSQQAKQRDLYSLSLVSHAWNEAATPALYAAPLLQGSAYDPFTQTICPSINFRVRRSPLAHLVQRLDLSLLVHQGSKSTTARLLGRTKDTLRRFAAPQASFSLNCFPALAKCRRLSVLDLSLVSEAASLQTLFDAVAHLRTLKVLHLPRSAGFGARVSPDSIRWPPRLREVTLSGGLEPEFWRGHFELPATLRHLRISHCPRIEEVDLSIFLSSLASTHVDSIVKLTIDHLPRLRHSSADHLLELFPSLLELSVSADYISARLLDCGHQPARDLARLQASMPEQTRVGMNGDVEYDSDSSSSSMTTSSGAGSKSEDDSISVLVPDFLHVINQRVHAIMPQPALPLVTLELTDSGHVDESTALDPLDLLTYAQGLGADGLSDAEDSVSIYDQGVLPCLSKVVVAASLGWTRSDDIEAVVEALADHLQAIGRGLGLDEAKCGVRIKYS